jgi:thioredoxin 2
VANLELDDRGVLVTCPSCGQKNRVAYERLGETVRCGKCKTELAGTATPFEVASTHDFDQLIAHASVPIVVDYWAPWCGPCRMVAPELVKVAARAHGRFLIVKVNTDALSDLGERFRIGRFRPWLSSRTGAKSRGRPARGRRRHRSVRRERALVRPGQRETRAQADEARRRSPAAATAGHSRRETPCALPARHATTTFTSVPER